MDPKMLESGILATPQVDESDPLVVFITWLLSLTAGKVIKSQEKLAWLRHFLPVIAFFVAVGTRAALDAVAGQELTKETLFRALAAASVAVLAHSQGRELQKLKDGPGSAEPKPVLEGEHVMTRPEEP